jgi:hypothetical protein
MLVELQEACPFFFYLMPLPHPLYLNVLVQLLLVRQQPLPAVSARLARQLPLP